MACDFLKTAALAHEQGRSGAPVLYAVLVHWILHYQGVKSFL